jgi:hypothetical protein
MYFYQVVADILLECRGVHARSFASHMVSFLFPGRIGELPGSTSHSSEYSLQQSSYFFLLRVVESLVPICVRIV